MLPRHGTSVEEPWLVTWFARGKALREVLPSASLSRSLLRSLARIVEGDDRGPPETLVVDTREAFEVFEHAFAGITNVRRGLVPGAPDAYHEHAAALRIRRHPSVASVYDLGVRPDTLRTLVSHGVALSELEPWPSSAARDERVGWIAEFLDDRDTRGVRIFRNHTDQAEFAASYELTPPTTAEAPLAFDVCIVPPSRLPPGWRLDAFRDRLPRVRGGAMVRVAAIGGASVRRCLLEREARFVAQVLEKILTSGR